MNYCISFFLALCMFSICIGQDYLEINGKILDRNSRTPLAYAHVGLTNASIGTVSNENGEFKIIISSDDRLDTLRVSFLGYQTHRAPVSSLAVSSVFYLQEAPIVLSDVVIQAKNLNVEAILLKATENLATNTGYPTNDFKLEGFYREIQRVDGNTVFLVESAFDIYGDRCNQPLRGIAIKEIRRIFQQPKLKTETYDHNNLLRLFDISTNFVVLAKHGLSAGKTTWAIGRRPYEISDISTYNGREVYIITHNNDFVSLKLIINADNFSVLRNEYHTRQPGDNFNNYFWKYHRGESKCGFYESHQVYEYREFNGKMYPHFFYRNDLSKCFDKSGKMESESSGVYQALISQIDLNRKRPEHLKDLKKHKGMQDIDLKYNEEFWSHYNIIMDVPREP